ncbi:MAG: exodeoxyribonuclease VII large subunit [Candidatus Limnocylindrales bacterium]
MRRPASADQTRLPFDDAAPADGQVSAAPADGQHAALGSPSTTRPAPSTTRPASLAVAAPQPPEQPQPLNAPRLVDTAGPRILAVGELTRVVRETLRDAPLLRDIWVEGEVGQVSISSAGHCYFTLKDEKAQLRCMIFRDDRLVIPFEARTGIRLVAHGRLDVFEPQGTYQLYVDALQPAGLGDLALRFEALKARLTREGLFDAKRKRPLPPWPRTIGIATSLSGAVLHDMRKVIGRRWPMVRVVVAACQVQGPGASTSIVHALRRLARWTDPLTGRAADIVILARGGGSQEDLWSFNEEAVVRAVAAHPCPIIVGVGHETDVTLAEFAADVRAATPSVAAELAVPSRLDHQASLRVLSGRLTAAGIRSVAVPRQILDHEQRALASFRPTAYLRAERERIGLLLDRATRSLQARLEADRSRLARTDDRLPMLLAGRMVRARTDLARSSASLAALGPFATLERGYAIVRDADGAVVRRATDVALGQLIDIRLARGALDVRVQQVRESAT